VLQCRNDNDAGFWSDEAHGQARVCLEKVRTTAPA